MSISFNGVSLSGIVVPGEFYMLFDADCGRVEGEIEQMYFIRSEEDLLKTLEIELEIVLPAMFPRSGFGGVRKLTNDRHEFRMICRDKDNRSFSRYLYFQRLKPYSEMLVEMRRIFSRNDLQRDVK